MLLTGCCRKSSFDIMNVRVVGRRLRESSQGVAWLVLFVVFAVLSGGAVAQGQENERIISFASSIKVHKDGLLRVVETIKVYAGGRSIKRGIYRDFPVRYRDKRGYLRSVGFKVISVSRDGRPENYFVQRSGDHKRIYIGRRDFFLEDGEYSYKITYETTRQLRYFYDYDELYWNVTGNNWSFPINKASVHIELPTGARIINKAAFTGRYGSTDGAFLVKPDGENAIDFETTRPLRPYEGLTVAIGWPKGIVAQPGPVAAFFLRIWDNLGVAFLLFGTVAVSAYFFIMWKWIGRDPEAGPIFPQFGPPRGLSPAAVSYVHYMGFRRASSGATKPFIAALVSLAVKGFIKLDDKGKDLVIRNTASRRSSTLANGEKALFDGLLGGRQELVFKQSSYPTVQSSRRNFKSAISKEHGSMFFKDNYLWFVLGLVMSVFVLGITFVLVQDEETIGLLIMQVILGALGSFLVSLGFQRLSNWLPGGDYKIVSVLLVVGGVFFLTSAVIVLLGVQNSPVWVPLCGTVLGVLNVLFVHLLRAPTVLGQKTMDAINGFKMYLEVAEKDRMNMNDAPRVDETIFEKFLPYAIGLGVEKPWTEAFEAELAKTLPPGETRSSYRPSWYSGSSNWNTGSIAGATAGIVGAVSAGMAVASPPSSSGSSGGGGFSGGGGGGGGGGGW